jgi:hypothetical protein
MEEEIDIQKKVAAKEEAYNKAVDALYEYRKELAGLKESSSNFFEKQLSYISAGSLGLSMVVVDKLFKNIALTEYKWLIIISWIGFGLTLFINLISHLYAGHLHNKSIKDIDDNNYDQSIVENRNSNIDFVNCISVVILFVGICCFILYTSINTYSMSTPDNNKVTATENNGKQSGSTPQPKPQTLNEGKSATAAPPSLPPSATPPTPKPTDKH